MQLNKIIVFLLDEQRFGLYLFPIERVVYAVEITQLPKAPDIVLGIINVQGKIIPVVNIRKRFRLPEKEIDLNDRIIIARTSKRAVALIVDAVKDIFDISGEIIISAEKIIPGMEYIKGVMKMEDGMILIHDLDTFLSLEEENTLDSVLIDAI